MFALVATCGLLVGAVGEAMAYVRGTESSLRISVFVFVALVGCGATFSRRERRRLAERMAQHAVFLGPDAIELRQLGMESVRILRADVVAVETSATHISLRCAGAAPGLWVTDAFEDFERLKSSLVARAPHVEVASVPKSGTARWHIVAGVGWVCAFMVTMVARDPVLVTVLGVPVVGSIVVWRVWLRRQVATVRALDAKGGDWWLLLLAAGKVLAVWMLPTPH